MGDTVTDRIQRTLKEYQSPVKNSSFDTFTAKMGRILTPKLVFKIIHLMAILLPDCLKPQFFFLKRLLLSK